MIIKTVLIVFPPLVRRKDNFDIAYKYLDFETYRLVTPIEPVTMATDLKRSGLEVSVFDLGTYYDDGNDALSEKLNQFKPDAVVVANSVLTFGSTFDVDGEDIFRMARKLFPNCVTILTGTHATNYPGVVVQKKICDFSIKGEPELAVGQLIKAFNYTKEFSSIDGLSCLKDDSTVFTHSNSTQLNLVDLPLPDYGLVQSDQQASYFKFLEYGKIRFPEKSHRYRDIQTSKGCILDCNFCSVKHLRGGQRYRRKSLDVILAEIKQALENGIQEIHFFDDLFIENEQQVFEFANALVKENLKFPWFVGQGMPLWPLTFDGLTALRETGMYRIICPFESGSDRVLKKVIGKLASVEHNSKVIEWSKKNDLEVIGLFVIGIPDETRDDLIKTIDFAENHSDIDYTVFSIATPLVGTRMTRKAVKQGIYQDKGLLKKVIKRTVALYHTDQFSEVELGLIRAFDWDRINFSTVERKKKYCQMVGITIEQLELSRKTSQEKFYHHFPSYDGILSFKDLYALNKTSKNCASIISK